jgi:Ni,Fe-hydrogenase maturation factor
MRVYVFGNEHVKRDRRAIEVARALEGAVEGVSFVFVGPNEDVPFAGERRAVILDTVEGIHDVTVLEGDSVDGLALSPRASVHDFDLVFQLKYLKKLGKLGEVTVVGVPQEGDPDHRRIQSILRKLVAHDMQGS